MASREQVIDAFPQRWLPGFDLHLVASRDQGIGRVPESLGDMGIRAHQEEFQRLLDALIAGRPTQEQMQVLTEHLSHVRPWRRWDGSPDQIREQRAQQYEDPERWEAFRQQLLAQGHDIGPPRRRHSPSRYVRRINAQDPLDELYWELDQFLAKGGQSCLRRCPQCGRYFVQATARPQTYCMTSCQQKANPTKRRQNAAYQRTYRAGQQQSQIKEDLKCVREFKQVFITAMGEPPTLEDVLEKLHIARRRWNRLVNQEIEQYDHPRDTDLTA
jgi:hypothetical protein